MYYIYVMLQLKRIELQMYPDISKEDLLNLLLTIIPLFSVQTRFDTMYLRTCLHLFMLIA